MLSLLFAVAVVILDQVSKLLVLKYLKPIGGVTLIDGVLDFTYLENTGAAFGTFSDNRVVFMTASVLIIVVLSIIVWKFHGQSKLFDICLGLILGGGIGNMIDRVRLGYVIDFVDFCAFDFWKYVFNVADSAVVIGCILAIVFVIIDKKSFAKTQEESSTDGVNDNE